MKYLIFAFLMTGCAQHQWVASNNPEQQKLLLAKNDCHVKAKIAVGAKQGNYDWGYLGRWNSFMRECMAGQGYELK